MGSRGGQGKISVIFTSSFTRTLGPSHVPSSSSSTRVEVESRGGSDTTRFGFCLTHPPSRDLSSFLWRPEDLSLGPGPGPPHYLFRRLLDSSTPLGFQTHQDPLTKRSYYPVDVPVRVLSIRSQVSGSTSVSDFLNRSFTTDRNEADSLRPVTLRQEVTDRPL